MPSSPQLRTTFHADEALPEEQRDLIIYCSRRNAGDRQVQGEDLLLELIAEHFPASELRVFAGEESVADTISLFRRAKVVAGMHGAGLSHSIFSAPGTAVVEFLFMNDPPMMFWHASAALAQRYIMVPLAQSWWLDQSVHVPAQDVIDALALALGIEAGSCEPGGSLSHQRPSTPASTVGRIHCLSPSLSLTGFFTDKDSGKCGPCPKGSYRPQYGVDGGGATCIVCAAGRVAASRGSAFCTTCPSGSYAEASGARWAVGRAARVFGVFELARGKATALYLQEC